MLSMTGFMLHLTKNTDLQACGEIFFFFWLLGLFAPWAVGILIHYFRCERCIQNPAPGRMRYTYIVIAVCSEH